MASKPEQDAGNDDTADARHLDTLLVRRLTPRQRTARGGVAAASVLLALVLLCALAPEVRRAAQEVVFGPTATPAPTLAPGSDAVWFVPAAPGETVQLDGRTLTALPLPGDPHPLRLSHGTHHIQWRADPFQPQSCVISVPAAPLDTCPTTPALDPATARPGRIVNTGESLATLPKEQRAALSTAINSALATVYSATVQPGEYYRTLNASQLSLPLTSAQQPLRATLRFEQELGWPEPCAVTSIIACRAQGQDCEQLCTLIVPALADSPLAIDPNELKAWYAALVVGLSWTYITDDGRVLSQGAPDTAFNLTLLVVRITWNGAHWSVVPVLGDIPGLPAANDTTCGALANDLDAWVLQDFPQHPYVDVRTQVRYAADADPTDGCVGIVTATSVGIGVTPTPITGTPPLLLHRFGVLLAANTAAHALWPAIPVADPSEQDLAARMAAALG